MQKRKWLNLTIFLLFFSIIAQIATASPLTGSTIQEGTTVGEIYYPTVFFGETIEGFGPGSEVPLRTPVESEYVWIDAVEPQKATWTFYKPGLRSILTIEKEITYKKQITSGEYAGMWAFADTATFTVPALADVGSWLAKPEITMKDGTVRQGVSAESPTAIYIAFSVISGDPFTNLFEAPWYLFNIQMPPLFWFPLILVWGPALFIGICYASPRISETLKRGLDRLSEARSKWKK